MPISQKKQPDSTPDTAPDIVIIPFDRAEMLRAKKLLSKAFNVAAARIQNDLETSLADTFNQAVFMATANGRLVGTVRCHRSADNPQWHSVSMLAVSPAHRNQGIGGKLMDYAEDFLQREWMKGRAAYVSLNDETRLHNPQSTFYDKRGYSLWEGVTDKETGAPTMYKWFNA